MTLLPTKRRHLVALFYISILCFNALELWRKLSVLSNELAVTDRLALMVICISVYT